MTEERCLQNQDYLFWFQSKTCVPEEIPYIVFGVSFVQTMSSAGNIEFVDYKEHTIPHSLHQRWVYLSDGLKHLSLIDSL